MSNKDQDKRSHEEQHKEEDTIEAMTDEVIEDSTDSTNNMDHDDDGDVSNESDTDNVDEAEPYTDDLVEQPSMPAPTTKTSGGGKIATLLSVAALGVGGYSLYLQKGPGAVINSASPSADTSQYQVVIDELKQDMSALSDQVSTINKTASESTALVASDASDSSTNTGGVDIEGLENKFTSKFAEIEARFEEALSVQNAASSEATANASDNSDAESRTGQLTEQMTQQLSALSAANENFGSQLATLKQEQSALTNSFSSVSEKLGDNNIDPSVWQLREAELLVSSAVNRMQSVRDIPASKRILQVALDNVSAIGRADLVNLANQLSGDIQLLDNVEVPNVGEVAASIDTLSQEVESLPLIGEGSSTKATSEVQAETEASENKITTASVGLLKSLTDLVDIKKDGRSIRPVISSEIRALTKQKTQLTLESAQLALISGNYSLAQDRLNSVKNWVESHFNVDDERVLSWIESINSLTGSVQEVELPDISGSLTSIRQVNQAGG